MGKVEVWDLKKVGPGVNWDQNQRESLQAGANLQSQLEQSEAGCPTL